MTASFDLIQARADIFKALGHPTRLTLVEALRDGPSCVCDLVELVPGAQATTSRHLDVLLHAGVVRRRREGVRMMYELALPCLLKAMPCVTDALRQRLRAQERTILSAR